MLKSFLERLKGDTQASKPEFLNESDARTAVAALLVHAAHVDQDYTDTERDLIASILAHIYKLRGEESVALRIEGEAAENECVDTFRFTNLIKTSLPESDRIIVLEGLWSVILSDEERHPNEDTLVRKLVEMLGLDPITSAHARQRVEAAMKS
ncbi:tellurite resistance TerB family protein [Hirschia baltica]|uniref:Co-chaperone DjlA N-terminal domain-containing protein n=1 Tax=Hirschia baltica (strain ATCC 49814 / DSM 5838 / IFAM 1418) TaxID=582402 RepID=C6XI19_HIRBI|nr:TerB family tellurite resistance protein [Hirschia baltica]ACT58845.1 protein of unknown function DUF1332 [Hirschia baltica ATCC 49814]